MTHESLVTLFEDTAESLADNVSFGYGSFDDFNSITNKSYPYIWLYPLKGEFPQGEAKVLSVISWDVQIDFLHPDNVRGAEFDTAQAWDKGFNLMEQFVHKLDEFALGVTYTDDVNSNAVSLSNVRFEPDRKATGDALTGWKLTFNILTNTDFEYCSIYE